MTSVFLSVFLVYWILGWVNLALWLDLLAWDMPMERYIIRRFGFDMAIAGGYWIVMYYLAFFGNMIVQHLVS